MAAGEITALLNELNSALSSKYIYAFLVFIAFVVAAKIVSFSFERIITAYAKKTKNEFDDRIAHALKNPIYYLIIVIGIYFSVNGIGLQNSAALYFDRTIKTLVSIIAAGALYRALCIFIDTLGQGVAGRTKTTIDDELLPLIKNLAKIGVILIALLQILTVWNFEITPLLASAGIAGFAIAFASKDIIGQFFGGVSIYVDKLFKKGDRVVLPSGETAIVEEVGVRSTRFKTFNSSTIIMPNSDIANAKIENLSWPPGKKKVKITVGVDYGSDVDKVKKALLFVAKKVPGVLDDPAPEVYFTEMAESSLNFLLICHVKKIEDVFGTKDILNTEIIKKFRKEKIGIPYPTRTIYVKK